MGILYCLYKRDFSKKYSTGLYKRSVFKTGVLDKIILNRDTKFILVF